MGISAPAAETPPPGAEVVEGAVGVSAPSCRVTPRHPTCDVHSRGRAARCSSGEGSPVPARGSEGEERTDGPMCNEN